MAYDVGQIEQGKIIAEVGRLKEDIKAMEARVEELEKIATKNDIDHLDFVRYSAFTSVQQSLQKLENAVVVMTPKQAKDAGNGWLSVVLKNPTYVMWLILATVVVAMIFNGYSYSEINDVLRRATP